MRLLFCLTCGTEFDVRGFDWLRDDEAATCTNCGCDMLPLESLTLAQRRKIELAYAIDTASLVPVQGRFL